MNVTLITHTPMPEKVVAAAAKLCYSDSKASELMENMSDEKAQQFVDMLAGLGHESPVEHVTFTFGIDGVSRSFLAQITRHRIASFSVQSQRYVKQNNFEFIIPPAIAADFELAEIYKKSMDDAINTYNILADRLQQKYIPMFLEQGLSEKAAYSKAEKMAIEDARYVLPNAGETKMVVTMNVRSLRNFFRLRCCNRAQWEIRAVADEMLTLCCEAAPALFNNAGPSCCAGACTEGKMTCGKSSEVREKYKAMRGNYNG